jgi:hypothetical protein
MVKTLTIRDSVYRKLVVRDLAGIGGRVLRWDAPLPELVR